LVLEILAQRLFPDLKNKNRFISLIIVQMILVTGATGFVGSYLTAELLKNKKRVRLFRRSSSDDTWFHAILKRELGEDYNKALESVEWFIGDLLNVVDVHEATSGVDAVFHAAALVSFDPKDKDLLMNVNVRGTEHVVNACLNSSNKPKLIHFSSTAAVGGHPNSTREMVEKDAANPENQTFYGRTKSLAEREVERGREEGLQAAILNPTIVLGFGNWHLGSAGFFKRAAKGSSMYTNGVNSFVDVRDVARCAWLLLDTERFKDRYLCVGWTTSFKDLLTELNQAFGKKPPHIRVSPMLAEIAWRLAWIPSLWGQKPFITKESARSSLKQLQYSNQKVSVDLGYTFFNQQECISYAVEGYKKNRPE
jgi:dihydroflavonol-4-reductase